MNKLHNNDHSQYGLWLQAPPYKVVCNTNLVVFIKISNSGSSSYEKTDQEEILEEPQMEDMINPPRVSLVTR